MGITADQILQKKILVSFRSQQQKIAKGSTERKKRCITYRRIRMIVNFSLETTQARTQWSNIFRGQKKRNKSVNIRFYPVQKYLLKQGLSVTYKRCKNLFPKHQNHKKSFKEVLREKNNIGWNPRTHKGVKSTRNGNSGQI